MESDHQLAERLATACGERLSALQVSRGVSRSAGWLEDAGDADAHAFLMDELAVARPADSVLSEEGHDDLSRLKASRVWIIDPLDGSSGFGQQNAEWAVHVALTVNGEISAGAVSAPGLGCVATTGAPQAVEPAARQRPVVAMGRSRAWSDGRAVSEALDAEVIVCGSAGVKGLLVMLGQADCYVHDGPLYEWDVCAPVAVARAGGLVAGTVRAEPMIFNKRRPVVSGLIVGHDDVVSAVRGVFN